MNQEHSNYPSGFFDLLKHLEKRERPFTNPLACLPCVDVDLHQLRDRVVEARSEPASESVSPGDFALKHAALSKEFDGQSELLFVHALVVAQLRRQDAAPEARTLFLRMWREQGEFLAQTLDIRWLISAATTFSDHGETVRQLMGGQGLSMLFDLIKLHDSERRVSGRPNDVAFPRIRGRQRHPIAFDMQPYSIEKGDLDKLMLARLWRLVGSDDVLRPLGFRMLHLVMTDKRTIFARVQRYKPKLDQNAEN